MTTEEVAQPKREDDGTVTVDSFTRYKCNICGRCTYVPADKGIPDGWEVIAPSFHAVLSEHICDVCMTPLRKTLDLFKKARAAFLYTCTQVTRNRMDPRRLAKGLTGDWEDKTSGLL